MQKEFETWQSRCTYILIFRTELEIFSFASPMVTRAQRTDCGVDTEQIREQGCEPDLPREDPTTSAGAGSVECLCSPCVLVPCVCRIPVHIRPQPSVG